MWSSVSFFYFLPYATHNHIEKENEKNKTLKLKLKNKKYIILLFDRVNGFFQHL